jgi:hypothetical protein
MRTWTGSAPDWVLQCCIESTSLNIGIPYITVDWYLVIHQISSRQRSNMISYRHPTFNVLGDELIKTPTTHEMIYLPTSNDCSLHFPTLSTSHHPISSLSLLPLESSRNADQVYWTMTSLQIIQVANIPWSCQPVPYRVEKKLTLYTG